MYSVEVKSVAGWTNHSTHESYRDAIDQADMVHGRVICDTGLPNDDAWKWASANQGFGGDLGAWNSLDDEERAAYEVGAGA